jgi:hypothetical protein
MYNPLGLTGSGRVRMIRILGIINAGMSELKAVAGYSLKGKSWAPDIWVPESVGPPILSERM